MPPPWAARVEQANAEARQPVLVVLPPEVAPADRAAWGEVFEAAGYTVLAVDWPGDVSPSDIGGATAYYADVARALSSRPAIVGQGPGGRVAQALSTDGLSAATVVLSPDPPEAAVSSAMDGSRSGPAADRSPLLAAEAGPGPFDRRAAETALAFIQGFV